MSPTDQAFMRRIRSFVHREGRMTKGQIRALETLLPLYGVAESSTQFNFAQIFGRSSPEAPVHMEIGFGNGECLASMAQQHPENNYLGIEVHRPGVGNLLLQIQQAGLQNVRLINDDAVEVLQQHISAQSLSAVYIFFADPWHKKKHHKRRLIQTPFINMLADKLRPGAVLHMATDWQDYAEHMLQVMNAAPQFMNTAGPGQYIPRPDYRPVTKFEKRGERLGHGVWDLAFIKL